VTVLSFTVFGVAINVGSYHAGQRGGRAVRERFSSIPVERWEQVDGWYERWGSGLLVLSAVPGLGTLLTAGAGVAGIRFLPFLLWVSSSKLVRNWLLALLFYGGYRRIAG
jgi:membrane protein YqaA with SNARE-associated domain